MTKMMCSGTRGKYFAKGSGGTFGAGGAIGVEVDAAAAAGVG